MVGLLNVTLDGCHYTPVSENSEREQRPDALAGFALSGIMCARAKDEIKRQRSCPANIPQAPSRPFIHELPNDWEQILNRVALGARKSDTIMRALLEELRRIQPRNVS